jgi:nucleotide-binding universal stress UspA family protein
MTVGRPRVIVGVDGTEGSIEALRWAAHDAARRSWPLHVITCAELPVSVEAVLVGADVSGSSMDATVREFGAVNERAVHLARSFGLALEVTGETVLGSAGYAVVSAASDDDLVVVGATSHPGRINDLLGSVATVVAHRAHGPVVVVHGADRRPAAIGRIVVGIDGSPCGDEALMWAVEEAMRSGAELELLHAWSYPYASGRTMPNDPRHEMRLDAMRTLERAELRAKGFCESLRVHSIVSEDSPANAIIEAGRNADLIVVGTRGRGGFASLMLGSVSRTVAQHATVPVVLLRRPE